VYEDIVARARLTTEAALRESRERVDLAVNRSEQADRKATDASKAVGERWSNRINAMRRRASDRATGQRATEMRFGHEDDPHPNDSAEGDELVSLVETTPSAVPEHRTQPFGVPDDEVVPEAQVAPVRQPDPASARYLSFGSDEEEDHRSPATPATRRAPAPSRRPRPRDDDDDDYSGQSWLESR
jgi:hypothetical protein